MKISLSASAVKQSDEAHMSHVGERREAKRISYICEVECEASGLNRLATRLNDLSLTGAFIDSMTCFSPGTVLKLRFCVKDFVIQTDAEVRYSMPQVGMGVRFKHLTPEHIAAMESLIEGKPRDSQEKTSPAEDPAKVSQLCESEMLVGNFAIVNMFDIIHLIENNHLGGRLAIKSPGAIGDIFFDDGQIIDAKTDSLSGTDALRRFLDVTEGSFEFTRSNTSQPRSIDSPSNMSLMLNLLRVKDEEAAVN
jgi:hypothetical protein